MVSLADLALVGAAAPMAIENPAVAGEVRELYGTWGPGVMCGQLRMLSTSPDDPEFRTCQEVLEGGARIRRQRGDWPQIPEDEFSTLLAVGIDRRGWLLAATRAGGFVRLHPEGTMKRFASLDAVVEELLSERAANALRTLTRISETPWKWVDYEVAFGLPASYRVGPVAERPRLLQALARQDEAAADAELEKLLAHEVCAWILLDLLHDLTGPAGESIPPELRESVARDWYRLLHRRLKATPFETGKKPPPVEIRNELGRDAVLAALHDRRSVPEDVRALLESNVIRTPADPFFTSSTGAPEVSIAPLADAAERGLLPSAGDRPVDALALAHEQAKAYRDADPTVDVGPLVARIEALHPAERLAYVHLLQRCSSWDESFTPNKAAFQTLEREAGKAWPTFVLMLRGDRRDPAVVALHLLKRCHLVDALPFLRSIVVAPHAGAARWEWEEALALAYTELGGELRPGDVDAMLARLPVTPPPRSWGVALLRGSPDERAAACLLRPHVKDDRVFEALLHNFADVHPYSSVILKERKGYPRIVEVLLTLLDREEEEARSTWGDDPMRRDPHPHYAEELGILAKTLAGLGVERGRIALDAFRAYKRWESRRSLG